jgi:hypothetical protein
MKCTAVSEELAASFFRAERWLTHRTAIKMEARGSTQTSPYYKQTVGCHTQKVQVSCISVTATTTVIIIITAITIIS